MKWKMENHWHVLHVSKANQKVWLHEDFFNPGTYRARCGKTNRGKTQVLYATTLAEAKQEVERAIPDQYK